MIFPAARSSWTACTFETISAGTSGLILPRPTPPEATSKTVSSPPENVPSSACWIDWKTALSTFFSALVRMWVPRYDWSASTPIPQTFFSFAAESAPSPHWPATWKTMSEPCAIWFERDLLALRLVDEVLRVGVQDRDARVCLPRPDPIAGDVVVDRRDLLASDCADHLLDPDSCALISPAR